MTGNAWARAAGAALALLALAGAAHAGRAALAHAIYHQAKYGVARGNPAGILRRCQTAHRLYPWNYRFCLWAAEEAFVGRFEPDGRENAELLAASGTWCDRGLALNPREPSLRLLKARLLALDSPAAALASWREYTTWSYWDPFNQAVLVELSARAGDYEGAMAALAVTKGTPYEKKARESLRAAWQAEAEQTLREGLDRRPAPGQNPAAGRK